MFRPLALMSLSVCLCTLGTNQLQAQQPTRGIHRGLGAAANRIGSRTLGRSSDQLSRTQNHAPSSADLGRRVNGIQRANVGLERFTPQKPDDTPRGSLSSNQERIYEHRLQQAEHLRDLSAANGNDKLLDTADRMETSAARNYERQTGVAPPAPPETVLEGEPVQTTPPPLPGREIASRAKRGFWVRPR